MKTSSLLHLLPLLILASFMIESSPVLAQDEPEAVRDTSGNNVQSGVQYYILPVVRGRGGGLTLGAPRNGSCPLNVVQDQNEVSSGLPLTFTPADPNEETIRNSRDLNIKFSAATTCVQSTVWTIQVDESTEQRIVTTGGVEGNPGASTLSNWFNIQKYEDDYKLVFCPTVCNTCRPFCGDIGIYIEDGVRRLALRTDQPFKVMFKRV